MIFVYGANPYSKLILSASNNIHYWISNTHQTHIYKKKEVKLLDNNNTTTTHTHMRARGRERGERQTDRQIQTETDRYQDRQTEMFSGGYANNLANKLCTETTIREKSRRNPNVRRSPAGVEGEERMGKGGGGGLGRRGVLGAVTVTRDDVKSHYASNGY